MTDNIADLAWKPTIPEAVKDLHEAIADGWFHGKAKPDGLVHNTLYDAANLLDEAAQALTRITGERDEAVNWTETVERHGTDGFDALGDAWLAMDAIKRVNNAVTSVFSKHSNDEIMERFKQHITNVMHVSFVEGCLVGVKAERVNSAAAESRAQAAEAERDRLAPVLRDMLARFELYAGPNDMHAGHHDIDLLRRVREALGETQPSAS